MGNVSCFGKSPAANREPLQRVNELVAVVGRRGGKSRAVATLAAYLASLVDHTDVLVKGERGVLLVVSLSQDVATIVLDHVAAAFESSPTSYRCRALAVLPTAGDVVVRASTARRSGNNTLSTPASEARSSLLIGCATPAQSPRSLMPRRPGAAPAIVVDADDIPHIAYIDFINGRLAYLKGNGSGGFVHPVTPDGGCRALTPSIALNSKGHPGIAYVDSVNGRLAYVQGDGSSAAGSRCGIRQRLRRASTTTLAWSKSASRARQGSRYS
jgi:hypothetical protein